MEREREVGAAAYYGGKIRKIAHEFLARAVRFQIRQRGAESPNLVSHGSLFISCGHE